MQNKIISKKLKNQNKGQKYIKICPKCQSLNIKVTNQGGSAGIIFGAPTLYKCLDCGYNNYAFPEININELKKKEEKN